MYYVVQTPHHIRPYLTSIAFLARDFRSWGCRVDSYQNDSPYIAEIRYREKKQDDVEWRIELMELWSREVLARRQQMRQQDRERGYLTQAVNPETDSLASENARLERITGALRDYVDELAYCCDSYQTHRATYTDPRPLPVGPAGLVSKYMRLLHRVQYTSNARIPDWSTSDLFVADQIMLEFHSPVLLKQQHLASALNKALCKDSGRIGRVVRDLKTGNVKVTLLVEISDLLVAQEVELEKIDPLPLYEKYENGEQPPEYAET